MAIIPKDRAFLSMKVVQESMDVHACRMSIAFADWIKENHWCYQEHFHEPSNWRYFNTHTDEDTYASTQELYDQFIESIKVTPS